MQLPVMPPIEPMLAKSVAAIPADMIYEPKWDGFRCIVFRDGDEVELASRGGKTLTRYFPEVVEQVRRQLPARCVVDGEIVIVRRQAGAEPKLDFDALSNRIHPADSRVQLLATETPADFVAFDLLALDDEDLMAVPYERRRARLETALATVEPPVHVTSITRDIDVARHWYEIFEGAGLDGVIAKPTDLGYEPNKRLMFKIKHERTADVVVAGFRWHKSGPVVGSLLLGLHDDAGILHHVGVASSFAAARRAELVEELAAYREGAADNHPWLTDGDGAGVGQRRPGEITRWNAKKDLAWEPLRLHVCEVAYEALQGGERFRHTARFRRWRPDREPASCTYDQLDQPARFDVDRVLAGTQK